MTGCSGRLVLALGMVMPLGCMSWQSGMPQMMMAPVHSSSSANPFVGDLSNAQAAQLCLTAGEALEKKGFAAEAIRQYENARQHDPLARTVARRLAILYDLQGDAPRAEAEYQRALQEQPGDAELLNDLGYFHYRHHRLQDAENWLRNAITINSRSAPAWINLGQVLASQGREEESYQAFAHVLRPAQAYSNLGVLLAKQGHTNEARRALQQAIALDPALEQPRAFLKALPSSPTHLVPAKLARKAAPPSNIPSIITPSRTANNALPKPTLYLPRPPLMRIPPPQPLSLPPMRINPVSVRPAPPPLSALSAAHRAAPSDEPVIVHGPIRPASMMSPTVPRRWPSVPPAPPPPLPPIAPRPSGTADAPIIIRTSASSVQTSTEGTAFTIDEPQSFPFSPSVPLKPATRTAPPLTAAAPPQAILTDCQGEQQAESGEK